MGNVWDSIKHLRWPGGAPGSQGGRFKKGGGGGGETGHTPTAHSGGGDAWAERIADDAGKRHDTSGHRDPATDPNLSPEMRDSLVRAQNNQAMYSTPDYGRSDPAAWAGQISNNIGAKRGDPVANDPRADLTPESRTPQVGADRADKHFDRLPASDAGDGSKEIAASELANLGDSYGTGGYEVQNPETGDWETITPESDPVGAGRGGVEDSTGFISTDGGGFYFTAEPNAGDYETDDEYEQALFDYENDPNGSINIRKKKP